MKKNRKKFKIIISYAILSFCFYNVANAENIFGGNFSENISKFIEALKSKSNLSEQSRESEENVKNHDDSKYDIAGFDLNIIEKDGCVFFNYVHKKTKSCFLFSSEQGQRSKIYIGYPPEDDKGTSHALEHLLATPVTSKLIDKRMNRISPREFNGKTNDSSIFIEFLNPVFEQDLNFEVDDDKNILKFILDEFLSPTFINKDKGRELFNREVFSTYNGKKVGRVYDEMSSDEIYEPSLSSNDNFRKYSHGGVPAEIEKLDLDDIIKSYKKYVVPNNILFYFPIGTNFNKFKKILNFVEKNYLSKVKDSKNISLSYKFKDADNRCISKTWDGNSKVFKDTPAIIHNGVPVEYNYKYVANLCFDVSDLGVDRKDALNLYGGSLNLLPDLMEFMKECGYGFVKFDGVDLYKGRLIFSLYGNDASKFTEDSLIENMKKILKKADSVVNMLKSPDSRYINGREIVDGMNSGSKFFASKSPETYRGSNNLEDLFVYSFVKHKDAFSDKVFSIENGKILDDGEIIKKNYRDHINGLFEDLSKKSILYINVYEKGEGVKSKNKEKNSKYDLYSSSPFKIDNYQDKDYFRFIEYVILNFVNSKIDEKGLSYKGLKPAPYVGGSFMYSCNPQSKEAIEEYFKSKEFIDKYKIYVIGKDKDKLKPGVYTIFSENNFRSLLYSYVGNLKTDIYYIDHLIKILKGYSKSFEDAINRGCYISNSSSLLSDIRNKIEDLSFIFDDEKTYNEYKKDFEKYDSYFREEVYGKNGLGEEEEKKFMKNIVQYSNFLVKYLSIISDDLNSRLDNVKTLDYDRILEGIKSCKLF